MEQCKTCKYAIHDYVLGELGFLNDVISCYKDKDIYAESCDECGYEKSDYQEQFHIGDELIYTVDENVRAIILNKGSNGYVLFISFGYPKYFKEHQMKKWEKTGNNYELIAKMYMYLSDEIRSKADVNIPL